MGAVSKTGHDHRSGQNAKFSGASNLQPVVLYLLRYREPDRMAETMIMAPRPKAPSVTICLDDSDSCRKANSEQLMMSKPRLLLPTALAVMLALAGCTVGPDFVRPKAPVLDQWSQADGAVLSQKPAERIRWWEAFGDPVLSALVKTAYENNYSLKVAGLRVLEARAQLGIAVGGPFPQTQQLNGSADYSSLSENAANTAAPDLNYGTYSVGANVTWELDFWGKFRRGIESADADLLGSIASYDDVLVLLVAQVADTYLVLRTAQEQLRVARDNVVIQQRSLQVSEARFRGGDVDELDYQQAKSQLLSTEATIPSLEVNLQKARNALSTLLGRPPGDLAEILGPQPGVIPAAPQGLAAGAPADLLRRRPDVRQAEFAAAAQSAQVGVAEAGLYPSFGLSGALGVVASDGTNTQASGKSGARQLFTGNSLNALGGPFFSWNILNYGRIRNNVRVQDALLQQLLVTYQETVLNAVKEVEDGMVAFLQSQKQEQILRSFEASAQRSLALSTVQYREGFTDFQRVLDSQNSLLQAQQQTVSARSTTARSAVLVYRALGGGWEIRAGHDFVDQETSEAMRKRTNWGQLLEPEATQPPFKGESSRYAWPDW
jgi:NodT family efflux transporter outer membrane factor (OMF) lipoprotein